MSEPVSPLMNARYEGLVTIEEIGPMGMITLRGDLAATDLRRAATAPTGVEMPQMREASTADGKGILWMSPDEVLVLCAYADVPGTVQSMTDALVGTHALVANVSDARAVFRLTGANVREVLAKLSPADLSPEGLPLGEVKRTRMAQVPAAFWLESEEEATVICFRSVADYVMGLLKTAAHPASAVGFF
ncbi:sarcosine oxidase subunit gamma [Pacificoceanicola onchidii]|uniref:sarcosine oxidase subunit gamma n=1 Tax=Pacificoceanicola onchidii TaxID=2562685 RepID=UPI0010A32E99|nr:sarcosine oxidase subunit gamma family protein [Pacificoceanicola onchidii]